MRHGAVFWFAISWQLLMSSIFSLWFFCLLWNVCWNYLPIWMFISLLSTFSNTLYTQMYARTHMHSVPLSFRCVLYKSFLPLGCSFHILHVAFWKEKKVVIFLWFSLSFFSCPSFLYQVQSHIALSLIYLFTPLISSWVFFFIVLEVLAMWLFLS